MSVKVKFALLSGLSASLASFFGKASGLVIFEDNFPMRILLFTLMLVCNAAVWTFFVRALQQSAQTLTVTIISASTNYFLSAIIGFVIFNEISTAVWWCGMGLILCGLCLIVQEENETNGKNYLD